MGRILNDTQSPDGVTIPETETKDSESPSLIRIKLCPQLVAPLPLEGLNDNYSVEEEMKIKKRKKKKNNKKSKLSPTNSQPSQSLYDAPSEIPSGSDLPKRASKKKKRKEASIDSLDNQTFEDEAEMAENGSKVVQSKLTLKEKKITTKRFSLESLSSTFSEGAVEDERQRNLTASSKK